MRRNYIIAMLALLAAIWVTLGANLFVLARALWPVL